MTNKKRILSLILVVTMLTALLAGCGGNTQTAEANNSVFTGDPDALRIFVRGNSTYAEALTKQFPDIDFDFYYYNGLNTSMTMNKLLEQDDFGDICISSLQVTDKVAKEHLLDLSGYAFCDNYEPSILSQFDTDSKIYQLPGYLSYRCMIYNKDMFDAHGWQEPHSFGELVALCKQIRQETDDVVPIVMGGAAQGYYFTTLTTYAQGEYLYTPEGQAWTREYLAGNAKAADGLGVGAEMLQELIDAEAFDYDKNLGYWDEDIFTHRLKTGEAAMMYGWGSSAVICKLIEEDPTQHYALIPFYNREGLAFLGTNISYNIGLSKTLGEKGNEKKLEKALRVLDWLATEEGISSLAPDSQTAIYPLKNAQNTNAPNLYRQLWDQHLDCIKMPMLYAGYEDIIVPVADRVVEAIQGKGTLDGICEYIDELHQGYLSKGAEAIEVGSFTQDFTHEQTVQQIAYILHSRGDSDISMVSDGNTVNHLANLYGVSLKFFEGPILEDQISCTIPGRSLTDSLVRMTLTGAQIKALAQNGKHAALYEGENRPRRTESEEGAIATANFDYYWAGMTVERDKEKIAAITLEDGTVMEDDKTYTVLFAPGDYTEEVAAVGNPVELGYTANELFLEYLQKNSPVSPIAVTR